MQESIQQNRTTQTIAIKKRRRMLLTSHNGGTPLTNGIVFHRMFDFYQHRALLHSKIMTDSSSGLNERIVQLKQFVSETVARIDFINDVMNVVEKHLTPSNQTRNSTKYYLYGSCVRFIIEQYLHTEQQEDHLSSDEFLNFAINHDIDFAIHASSDSERRNIVNDLYTYASDHYGHVLEKSPFSYSDTAIQQNDVDADESSKYKTIPVDVVDDNETYILWIPCGENNTREMYDPEAVCDTSEKKFIRVEIVFSSCYKTPIVANDFTVNNSIMQRVDNKWYLITNAITLCDIEQKVLHPTCSVSLSEPKMLYRASKLHVCGYKPYNIVQTMFSPSPPIPDEDINKLKSIEKQQKLLRIHSFLPTNLTIENREIDTNTWSNTICFLKRHNHNSLRFNRLVEKRKERKMFQTLSELKRPMTVTQPHLKINFIQSENITNFCFSDFILGPIFCEMMKTWDECTRNAIARLHDDVDYTVPENSVAASTQWLFSSELIFCKRNAHKPTDNKFEHEFTLIMDTVECICNRMQFTYLTDIHAYSAKDEYRIFADAICDWICNPKNFQSYMITSENIHKLTEMFLKKFVYSAQFMVLEQIDMRQPNDDGLVIQNAMQNYFYKFLQKALHFHLHVLNKLVDNPLPFLKYILKTACYYLEHYYWKICDNPNATWMEKMLYDFQRALEREITRTPRTGSVDADVMAKVSELRFDVFFPLQKEHQGMPKDIVNFEVTIARLFDVELRQ